MSKAGTIEGISGLQQGRNLQIKPYALAGNSRGAQVPSASLGSKADVGGDIKYGVTPSLTLDLTYNTDFSQVEVDQQVVNLTRFGILFPERREFFIENSGSFTFGDVAERNYRMGAELRDFTLFNSRQIGLTGDGLPIPITGGGRLTGRVAGWEVGMLDMQTQRAGASAAENFGVVRLRRNVWGNSDIGVLAANRQATDGSEAFNRSYGVDANIRLLGNLIINTYLAGSRADTATSNGSAGRVSVAYRGRAASGGEPLPRGRTLRGHGWRTAVTTRGRGPGSEFPARRRTQARGERLVRSPRSAVHAIRRAHHSRGELRVPQREGHLYLDAALSALRERQCAGG